MDFAARHVHVPDVVLDGGDLDCGSGLLLLIRERIDPLAAGGLLEIRSTESSVAEDLPAWCRLTGNELVSATQDGRARSYLVSKGRFDATARRAPTVAASTPRSVARAGFAFPTEAPVFAAELPRPAPGRPIAPLSVTGIGSWPRPSWLVRALHDRLAGRLPEAEFAAAADDAVRLAVAAQERAGVDVATDGEQRRDNYASFVGARLQNCRLVPLDDLLPLVDDPEKLAADFASLDVPASAVRHPVVFGPLGRARPLAVDELRFLRATSSLPTKIALPGPYLLARTMWLECLSDRAYATREELAADLVRALREEAAFLLAEGCDLVQFDEPVLTEVVHGRPAGGRSFMCGALSERGEAAAELAFARDLVNAVVAGLPRDRVALHVCRGNWTPDESAALRGDYGPLVPTLASMDVGTLFLELCTPRAGEWEHLKGLRPDQRIGVGAVNQKHAAADPPEDVARRIERAARLFGEDRLLLAPDCGFATFADNPVASAAVAEGKLRALAAGRDLVRGRRGGSS